MKRCLFRWNYASVSGHRKEAQRGVHTEMEDDRRLVVVLGTSHCVQMAENSTYRTIDDPDYGRLVERLITVFEIDALFEEASECGPTSAQKLSGRLELKYHDVDPHPEKRHLYGLSGLTGEPLAEPFDFAHRMFPDAHFRREDFWVDAIVRQSFQKALVICGFLHTLSLSGRLDSAGFEVDAYVYVPYDKLCDKVHSACTMPA